MEQKKNNKKLVIIIAIAVVVIVAIVGVVVFMSSKGGNGTGTKDVAKMSKEEMLENSSKLSLIRINAEMKENSLNAKEEYNGKIYQYTGAIDEITENYVVLNSQGKLEERILVYLSKEEIRQFKKGQVIVVVGELQFENSYDYKLKNAYFVTDSIDIKLGIIGLVLNNAKKVDWADYCRITVTEKNSADFYYYLDDYADIVTDNGEKIKSLGGVNITGAKAVKENGKIMIKSYDKIEAISPEEMERIAEMLDK